MIYGNAANSYKIQQLRKEDEKLEMDGFKRISYSKKERKEMKKKIHALEKEDLFEDGVQEIK